MRTRGFTLVEVLVALVIVAAGASAVLASLNTAATSTVYLRDKTFAQWIAGNRIAETRLATNPPQNGRTEGELDYGGRRWQWRQQIDDAGLPGLRRIDVSVRPAEAGGPPAGDDWTITVSGVLGRDLAPPGSMLEWEPRPQPGPGGSGDGTPAVGDAGQSGGEPGASQDGAGGGITQGPRT